MKVEDFKVGPARITFARFLRDGQLRLMVSVGNIHFTEAEFDTLCLLYQTEKDNAAQEEDGNDAGRDAGTGRS